MRSTMCAIYHRPLIPLTLALMGGIAVGAEAPGLGAWALAAAAACALAVGPQPPAPRPGRGLAAASIRGLGYSLLQPWIQPRFSDDHLTRFVDTGVWRITGVVDARPLEFESRTRFVSARRARGERRERRRGRRPAAGDPERGDARPRSSRATASRSAAASAPSAASTTRAASTPGADGVPGYLVQRLRGRGRPGRPGRERAERGLWRRSTGCAAPSPT